MKQQGTTLLNIRSYSTVGPHCSQIDSIRARIPVHWENSLRH